MFSFGLANFLKFAIDQSMQLLEIFTVLLIFFFSFSTLHGKFATTNSESMNENSHIKSYINPKLKY